MNDTIREIRFINGITYRNLENITSGNYDFLQNNITPDMIGYVGHKFFKGYLFKIDYLHRKITFYKNSSERITSSKSKGAVIRSGTDSYGDTLLTVKNIVLDGKFKTALRGVESTLFKDTRTIRKELEITEANLMTIGYPFMSQYKTVWDYARKKIYILEY